MATKFLKITPLTVGQTGKETTVNNALARVEHATQRGFEVDMSGGNVGLTEDQFTQNFRFFCTGVAAAQTLTVPNEIDSNGANTAERVFAVENQDDEFAVTVVQSGGAESVTVYPGEIVLIYADGSEVARLETRGGDIPVKTEAGTSYTLTMADLLPKYIRMTNGSANTVTVPPNSSVPAPIGAQVMIRQAGAGQTTIAAGAGVTITSPETLKARAQHSTLALIKVATDTWDLSGDLEASP